MGGEPYGYYQFQPDKKPVYPIDVESLSSFFTFIRTYDPGYKLANRGNAKLPSPKAKKEEKKSPEPSAPAPSGTVKI